jgi:hypothetical protein
MNVKFTLKLVMAAKELFLEEEKHMLVKADHEEAMVDMVAMLLLLVIIMKIVYLI